jgi:hypothetical protein
MTLTSSALAALLVCTACEEPMDQTAQRDQTAPSEQTMTEQTVPADRAPLDQPAGSNTLAPQQTAGVPLTDVQNPEQTLAKAQVKDAKGEAIGEVQSVSLGPDGKVQMVNIDVGTRTVALEVSSLTYVQADNTVVTEKSKDEIQQMP